MSFFRIFNQSFLFKEHMESTPVRLMKNQIISDQHVVRILVVQRLAVHVKPSYYYCSCVLYRKKNNNFNRCKSDYIHKKFFYSKGTEGRELKLVSSLSAFVYLNIVRGSLLITSPTQMICVGDVMRREPLTMFK